MNTRPVLAATLSLMVLGWVPRVSGAAVVCQAADAPALFEVSFAPERDEALGGQVRADGPWRHVFEPPAPAADVPAPLLADTQAAPAQEPVSSRPRAVQLSSGYETRLKIHRIASWATVPLFATEYILGEKLYDGDYSDGVKSAHSAFAAGIAVLFGVNTVTGVWNLWEGRQKTEGRTRRWVHGLLMIGADAGFVATGMLAPGDDDEGGDGGNRSTHRTVAITSMGVAAASYVYMLLTR